MAQEVGNWSRTLQCPRCSRSNPSMARYCFFDGTDLRGGPPQPVVWPRELVFPSGKRCRSAADFVRVCTEEWAAARELLRKGYLREYFASLGRSDLALAAREASQQNDLDLALDTLLEKVAGAEPAEPRLRLEPRRFDLGRVSSRDLRTLKVTVRNAGVRLLRGRVQAESLGWLRLADGTTEKEFATPTNLDVNFVVDTRSLSAGHVYRGCLRFISNGGAFEIPVHFELPVIPFPYAPFDGIIAPMELAKAIRKAPEQAVPLFEKGLVRSWYEQNGWKYPVADAVAPGLAAVQQFFEALGLVSAPVVTLLDTRFELALPEGESQEIVWQLQSEPARWIYATLASDADWLQPRAQAVSGPGRAQAVYAVQAPARCAGTRLEGHAHMRVNGGRVLCGTVALEVRAMPGLSLAEISRAALVAGGVLFSLRTILALLEAREGGWHSFGALEYNPAGYWMPHVSALLALVFGYCLWRYLRWQAQRSQESLRIVSCVFSVVAAGLMGAVGSILLCLSSERLVALVLPSDWPLMAPVSWGLLGIVLAVLTSLVRPGVVRSLMTTRPAVRLGARVP